MLKFKRENMKLIRSLEECENCEHKIKLVKDKWVHYYGGRGCSVNHAGHFTNYGAKHWND